MWVTPEPATPGAVSKPVTVGVKPQLVRVVQHADRLREGELRPGPEMGPQR